MRNLISDEAEMGLLGAILVNDDALSRVAPILRPEHFAVDRHRLMYEAMCRLVDEGKKAIGPMIAAAFPEEERAEVNRYMARLASSAPTVVNAGHYAKVLYQLAVVRDAVQAAQEMLEEVPHFDPNGPLSALLGPLSEVIDNSLDLDAATRPATTIGKAAQGALERAMEARDRGVGISGLSTGIEDLDAVLGGLRGGELIIVAGATGMGKTALGVTLAINVAKLGRGVALFSLEMSETEIGWRALARESGIAGSRQMTGRFSRREDASLLAALQAVEGLPVHLDDNAMASVAHVRRRVRRIQQRQPVDLIIVDYLQLLVPDRSAGNRGDSRATEVANITRGLKVLAKDLNVPVIALSQLSRGIDARIDKRPQLSDLRESGAIEQDADAVLFVYREEYYERRAAPPTQNQKETSEAFKERLASWYADLDKIKKEADILVAKNRHGPTRDVKVGFSVDRGHFHDLVQQHSDDADMETFV